MTKMSGNQAINTYFSRLAETSPAMAEYLKNLDFIPLIKECAVNAIMTLKDSGIRAGILNGVQRLENVNYEKIGVIHGHRDMLVLMDKKGNIICYGTANEYGSSELKRREQLFQQAFKQEVVKAAVDIMDYNVIYLKQEVRGSRGGTQELVMEMEVEQ
jgi:hypothetical protein